MGDGSGWGPDDAGPDGTDPDFDAAVQRFLEQADAQGAPHEPSYEERQRAARQADLIRRLDEQADHDARLADRDREVEHKKSASTRRSRWLAPLIVIALLAGVLYLTTRGGGDPVASVQSAPRPSNWPSKAARVSTKPLGTPPALPAESGPFKFLSTHDDGTPVTWDPCRQIHYVVNPAGQPADGGAVIQAAIARASEATGLHFVNDGATDETWTSKRPSFQPDRYGDRWAPVLIVWSNAASVPELAPDPTTVPVVGNDGTVVGERVLDPAGIGGPVTAGIDEDEVAYVSGEVALDIDTLAPVLAAPGGADGARAVVQHEIGHVLGLGHVDDATQLMNPVTTPGLNDWGAGDMRGLHALGTGTCHPEL